MVVHSLPHAASTRPNARPRRQQAPRLQARLVEALALPAGLGIHAGKFLTDPVWWFFLFWLPQYFNSRFKLDLSHIGLPLVVVYLSSTVGSVYGGWLPRATCAWVWR